MNSPLTQGSRKTEYLSRIKGSGSMGVSAIVLGKVSGLPGVF